MSKAVMLSIRPKWCEKIINGDKTIEVRKTRPKLETPFKCYIYCTLPKYPHEDFIATDYPSPQFYGGGKVIGEFTCDRIYELAPINHAPDDLEKQACLTREEIVNYLIAIGGIAAILAALCFLWWLVETAWIAASNRFRDICKAESLIFEYRRERKEYLWWKEHVKGNVYADDHD